MAPSRDGCDTRRTWVLDAGSRKVSERRESNSQMPLVSGVWISSYIVRFITSRSLENFLRAVLGC